jgi:hypothetical protein
MKAVVLFTLWAVIVVVTLWIFFSFLQVSGRLLWG